MSTHSKITLTGIVIAIVMAAYTLWCYITYKDELPMYVVVSMTIIIAIVMFALAYHESNRPVDRGKEKWPRRSDDDRPIE